MVVTIELDDIMIDAIAERVAIDRSYDWGSDPDTSDNLTAIQK